MGLRRETFTLVETMIALAIFSVVIVIVGALFVSVQDSWRRQKNMLDAFQNIGWAIEFMNNELRRAESNSVSVTSGGSSIEFRIDPDSDGNPPWYWIEYSYDSATKKIYRRWRQINPTTPWSVHKDLARSVVSNPSGNDFFVLGGTGNNRTVTIELTTRPNPDEPEGKGNINYTLVTLIRVRN